MDFNKYKDYIYEKYGKGIRREIWDTLICHSTFTDNQTSWRHQSVGVGETGAFLAALNTNLNVFLGGIWGIRFLVQETTGGTVNNKTYQLEARLNGGTPFDVTGSSTILQAAAGGAVDGEDTTQRIGSGTFITPNDGVDEVDGLAGGANLDFSGNDEVELLYSLQLIDGDSAPGDLIEVRVKGIAGFTAPEWAGVVAVINVPVGALTFTGFVPTVLETGTTIVEVPVGTLSLTGLVPTVKESVLVDVPTGTLTFTGFIPTAQETVNTIVNIPTETLNLTGFILTLNLSVDVPVGNLSLAGFIPTVQESVVINVPAGSLSFTGFVPIALENTIVNIPTGFLTLSGFAPTPGENIVIDVPTIGLTLTGFVPVAQTEIVVDVPTVNMTLSGFVSLVLENTIIDIPVGSLNFTGFIPVVLEGTIIDIPVGNLSLIGFIPALLENTIVNVPAGSLVLGGFAPLTIFNIVINVPIGNLSLTGFTPVLDIGIDIPPAELILASFVPSVFINTVVNVPTGNILLTGFIPLVIQNTLINVPVAGLILAGFIPVPVETANDIVVDVITGTLTLIGLTPVGLVGGDGAVAPGTGILKLTGFEPNLVLTIFNIESCDMDIIFAKPVDELIIPKLQDIEFNLDRLKKINLPDPIIVDIEEFRALEPVAPSKEVERITFLYKDFALTVQNVIDGKIAELTNEIKPYDIEMIEWGRSKEDLLDESEEAIETSFDGEASRGFVAPSGVFNKDISKQSIKLKKSISRANEVFFSEQNSKTLQNMTDGLQAGNQAENIVRTTDIERQTINLQAVQNLVDIDFKVFELYLQRHNSSISVKRIKHQAWIEELRGQLLILQEREIAIKGYSLNLVERTKQIEMFNISIDYLNAKQVLKEIELENFVLQAETERNKLLKFQAEVDKFSALINLNIARFNLYKAGIEFEESKVDRFREEAAVAEAQLGVQNAKTTAGRIKGDTKLDIANAKLQAQLEKLRAARSRLDTVLTEGRARAFNFSGDLLVYQSDLRDWLTNNTDEILENITQKESGRDLDITFLRDLSRKEVNTVKFATEAQNIADLGNLNAEVISKSADITAKTEVTSKLVHSLIGG